MLHRAAPLQPVAFTHCLSDTYRERRWRWIFITLMLLCCGFFALPHDLGIARFIQTGSLPQSLGEILEKAETFAHGIGIAAILIILFVVDHSRRWAIPRVILAVVSAGLAANGITLLVGRLRPYAADLTAEFTDSFTSVLPLFSVGSTERSSPSAHTAVAVAFAIGLGWLYPRGRYVFMTLAVLAAVQRIAGSAHFLSDVFWGGSLGYFLGRGIMTGWLTGGHFDRLEGKRYMATTGLASRVESPAVQPTRRKHAA